MTEAVRDLVRRLGSLATVNDVRSPLQSPNWMLRSADGRSVLITFDVAGDFNRVWLLTTSGRQ
jgi:hypothetical protein